MRAAGVARRNYAHASSNSEFRATATVVLDVHRDDNGFCLGCYVYFRQLKPFPCEYHSWAARVLVTYPAPTPAAGRPPAQDLRPEGTRPAPALRVVPPLTSSASDDTVLIRLE